MGAPTLRLLYEPFVKSVLRKINASCELLQRGEPTAQKVPPDRGGYSESG